MPDLTFEATYAEHGPVCGVDEVGRGPWAGPVLAAAVILDLNAVPTGLNDSKKLTARRRDALYDEIMATAATGFGQASVAEIDTLNILRASHLAMCRAIAALPHAPGFALIDGRDLPRDLPCPGLPVIKGDGRSASIAAASIIAKVKRDRLMAELAHDHPGYGWERNMGYGTRAHQDGLKVLGVTPHHRRSFAPIHKMLSEERNITS